MSQFFLNFFAKALDVWKNIAIFAEQKEKR